MIKKTLISLALFIAVGFGLLKILTHTIRMEWGHPFAFENELGIELDSLEIIIGNVNTIIPAGSDSLRTLEGNIKVPKNGYPHKVSIKVFYNENTMTLKADSFNCYNCDGSHEYTLKQSGAEYRFVN